ncbi:MAG TPA: methionyl-tRNA formyltransferase [Actinomycetota bacterium]|nr:methionyl-tRNA formyltransferase [Actinomycetota bacterium]
MRVAFFGTPAAAVPTLEALIESPLEVVVCVTNPDRPSGRGMRLTPPPVKSAALSAGIDVMQPGSVRDRAWIDEFAGLRSEVAVVVAYGKILPAELLTVPALGFVNVHMSLLPAYRGAAPIQRALMDGAATTGVSIMLLTEGMDEGPVLAQRSVEVGPEETAGELEERLAMLGATTLVETLPGYGRADITPIPQDQSKATYAPKISGKDARIDWAAPAAEIHNQVRALNPDPGAFTRLRGSTLKMWRVAETEGDGDLAPGELMFTDELLVGAGDRALRVVEAQIAGKKRLPGPDLARGLRLEAGERLG